MDFLNKLNSNNKFRIENMASGVSGVTSSDGNLFSHLFKKENMVNIICGILLIILIIVLLVCLCKSKDKFVNKTQNKKENDNNEKTAIILHRDGCPYSNKLVDMLKNMGMKIKDLKFEVLDINGNGKQLAHRFGARGTPTTVYPYLGNKVVGLVQDPMELYHKLMNGDKKENNDNDNGNGDNTDDNGVKKDIAIVYNEGCPFCKKMKAVLDDKLGKNNYEIIDSQSEKAQKLLEKYEMKGVPLTIKQSTGQCIKGYNNDISEILD